MNKKKIISLALILLICPTILIIKDKLTSKEEICVLTEENNISQEVDNKKENNTQKEDNNISNKEITVYVSGEVKKSGVVTLKEGDSWPKFLIIAIFLRKIFLISIMYFIMLLITSRQLCYIQKKVIVFCRK